MVPVPEHLTGMLYTIILTRDYTNIIKPKKFPSTEIAILMHQTGTKVNIDV